MSALILPRRFSQQPSRDAVIDDAYLSGLRAAVRFDGHIYGITRNLQASVVGTRQFSAGSPGLAFNNNQDSYVALSGLGDWSGVNGYTALVFANLTGSDSYAGVYAKQSTSGNNSFQLQRNATANKFIVQHGTGGTAQFTTDGAFSPNAIFGVDAVTAITWDKSNVRGYINGDLKQTIAYTTAISSGTADLKIGAARDSTTLAFGGRYYLFLLWDRALSTGEIAGIGRNPWQIFKPRRNVLYFGGSGSGITITVADASHGHAADGLTLTTATALSAADALHGHAADQAALSTNWLLAVADAASAHVADGPALTVASVLAVADALHAHISDSLGLSTRWLLTVADALHGHAADNALLDTSLATTLTAQDALHGHTADVLALVTNWLLAVADAAHGHAADNVTLSATGSVDLALADAVHAHLADNAGLSTATTLAILEAIHAHTAEALTLFFSSFTQAQLDEILAYVEANMAVPTANEIAIAVWQMVLEGALTAEQMQRIMLAALAGKRQGLGTGTEEYLGVDGATPRVTFTPDDANGNGTTVVDGA